MKDRTKGGKNGRLDSEGILLKTSRISFISNYLLAFLAAILLLLFIFSFNIEFTFFPKTKNQMFTTLGVLGIAAILAFLIEQPEIERWMRQYIVTENEVIEIEGIISKKKIILPYASISEVTIRKNPIGRILNYGDIFIGAFRTGSDINMKGIRRADEIHEIIQNKINLVREGQLTFFKKDDKEK